MNTVMRCTVSDGGGHLLAYDTFSTLSLLHHKESMVPMVVNNY